MKVFKFYTDSADTESLESSAEDFNVQKIEIDDFEIAKPKAKRVENVVIPTNTKMIRKLSTRNAVGSPTKKSLKRLASQSQNKLNRKRSMRIKQQNQGQLATRTPQQD